MRYAGLTKLIDTTLRCITSTAHSQRVSPAAQASQTETLSIQQRRCSAGLMRINHVGEVCAQALYLGQQLLSKNPQLAQSLTQAAAEEIDHLAWCQERLQALDTHASFLLPIWFSGALAMGLLAGLSGDQWNLGFLGETETQVAQHLADHLKQIPQEDRKSKAVLQKMLEEEEQHAEMAYALGGHTLPEPIKYIMRLNAGIMKKIAYYV